MYQSKIGKKPRHVALQLKNKQKRQIIAAALKPKTCLEKSLHMYIARFHDRQGLKTPVPHPCDTDQVIYCIYASNGQKHSPVYVGQTKHSAFWRMTNEISQSFSLQSNTPISKFIRITGRYNIRVMALQHIPDWTQSNHWERAWIHYLGSHSIAIRGVALNTSHMFDSLRSHKRTNNKRTLRRYGQQNTENWSNKYIVSEKILKNIHYTITYPFIETTAPPPIKRMNTKKLYNILSYLTGKLHTLNPRPINNSEIEQITEFHTTIRQQYPAKHIHLLQQYVTQQIHDNILYLKNYHKNSGKNKKQIQPFNIFVLKHYNKFYKQLRIPHVLNNNKSLLPKNIQNFIKPTIVTRNLKPTSQFIYNFKETTDSISLTNTQNHNYTCNCHNIHKKYKQDGHINTANMNVVTTVLGQYKAATKLQNLMKLGVKYVEKPQVSKAHITKHILLALDAFAAKLTEKFPMFEASIFQTWKQKCANDLLHTIQQNTMKYNKQTPILADGTVRTSLSKLQDNFVITCTDKFPNNYSIVCKQYWIQQLIQNTVNDKSYSKITKKTISNIIDRHSKYLSTGFRCFFDIETSTDLRELLHELNNTPNHTPISAKSADIEGWYNYVDHYDAHIVLRKTIKEIFESIKKKRYLVTYKHKYYWTNTHINNTHHRHLFTSRLLVRLLVWRMRNQYQTIGAILLKQIKGTGQGDNHSGHLCRLLSIAYERKFMKHWVQHDKKVATLFNYTVRKHDDYLFINNDQPQLYLKRTNNGPGLLPSYFKLNWTNKPPYNTANYLDTTIHVINNPHKNKNTQDTKLHNLTQLELRKIAKKYKVPQHGTKSVLINRLLNYSNPYNNFHNKDLVWNIKTYNKKDDLKVNFPINSMPHYDSNIPYHILVGTVIGRLHSLLTTNYLSLDDFIYNTIKLIKHLSTNNNYPVKLLTMTVKKFIQRNTPMYKHGTKYVTKKFLLAVNELTASLPSAKWVNVRRHNPGYQPNNALHTHHRARH